MKTKALFDLSGKVAVVTAGGHGLGREYCIAMAEFGADVVCNDVDVALAKETLEYLRPFEHRAVAIQGDVSKPEDVERLVSETLRTFGRIDIFFCNAGITNRFVLPHELTYEDWSKVVAVNLRGTFLCMKAVLPSMLKQKKGSIISTASVAGLPGGFAPDSSVYGATKAAIIGLTRHAAVAYAKEGIRINAIAPGIHDTRPVGLGISPEKQEELKPLLAQRIPMGRIGEPSEIRGLAAYLASDASSYVTGQVFVEDGGYIA
ncbi:MAG TPA: SDR family NAD(P)-dependent oxidoreductase [Thermodesulfobacteriota bacterium]|nr:SDR family NAD(P)-dependent oxidoreductase [Thermodesulfobacteriota bacterium]